MPFQQDLQGEYVRMREVEENGEALEEPAMNEVTSLLRFHLRDWIVFGMLVIVDTVLNGMHPHHQHVNTFMIASLSYPHRSNTVPFWSLTIISFFLPLTVMSVIFSVKRNIRDLHHCILGLVFTLAITAVLTNAMKVAVGRPRPDFMKRCFPGGFGTWNFDLHNGDVICSSDVSRAFIEEGYKSFPSGHTSWSFAGLGYLSWYLAGKLVLYDKAGHTFKLPAAWCPLLLATLVAISRVDDYRHHWQDVVVGALLVAVVYWGMVGLVVATIVYHQLFPPIHALDSGIASIALPSAPLRTVDAIIIESRPTQVSLRQTLRQEPSSTDEVWTVLSGYRKRFLRSFLWP